MDSKIAISDNLLYFPQLDEVGIKNFATYNNEYWGAMSLRNISSIDKYKQLFPDSDEMIYMAPDHNNNVQIIDNRNLQLYRQFNKHEASVDNFSILTINTDSIITKEKVPLLVSPADCSIIVLTGIDKKDNKKFLSFTHAGIWGTMVDVHTKTLDLILHYYDINSEDIDAFLFPNVSYKYYKKNKQNDIRAKLLKEPEWESFVHPEEEVFGIDVEGKIMNDLKKSGIHNISVTGLDTYTENEKGNLFSLTYAKAQNIEPKNFAVGAGLM